jgi:pimeloyl-ACP methyl ester carboxylesterase
MLNRRDFTGVASCALSGLAEFVSSAAMAQGAPPAERKVLAHIGGPFLDIDGNKVFALSFGKGPRTFLAHSGWIGNFEDWIAVLAPLSETWRTVVYDHRGTGETPVPVEKITDEALVDDVFRVMDALGIDRCVLGGFSRGSVTALRAVVRDPARFEGLVLMNGTGGVQRPDAAPRPRVAPSQWPGETFRERLSWFRGRGARSTLGCEHPITIDSRSGRQVGYHATCE